ncbi:MAG: ABC transporter permease [Microvirga sp.]
MTRTRRSAFRGPAWIGLLILGALVATAALAPILYPRDPMAMIGPRSLWPFTNASFPLGTDQLGRDVAAQLVHGARVSLTIGAGAALFAIVLGVLVGVLAGYCGKLVDDVLIRICEYFQTVPAFFFSLVLVALLSPSIGSVTLAIGLTTWPEIARLARAEVLRVKRADFVLAARTMGIGSARILVSHIVPNSVTPVIVMISAVVAHAILVEAALSFLGLGDPNTISWGSMIGNARPLLRTLWYLTALPGLAIFITVMAVTLIGNGLVDLANPREAARA